MLKPEKPLETKLLPDNYHANERIRANGNAIFCKTGHRNGMVCYWKATRLKWHKALGTDTNHLKYHDHLKLAHYANAAVDIEYKFPFGFKEVEGIHSRTDFDLSRHQEFSGKNFNTLTLKPIRIMFLM